MPPQSVLIVGASRGLGLALVKKYATLVPPEKVIATVRGKAEEGMFPPGVTVVEDIDVSEEECGRKIEAGLQGTAVEVVVIVAGLLKPEVSHRQADSVRLAAL
jgi:NAD(P)-dependent dehydrogenase (short-subunit alcohol dehydrogenase family)